MHEKRINEFCSAHVQRLRFTVIRIILIMECHTGIIHRIDSAVTDGAAEYIPGKIGNCITKAIKRFFDMRNPVLMIKLVDECFPFADCQPKRPPVPYSAATLELKWRSAKDTLNGQNFQL